MSAVRETIQDFGEASTTHGVNYILQRDQILVHRFLWLGIVSAAAVFAGFLSNDAYTSWQNNPILTTVSTTALPIAKLKYPAITVCGQGMATDTLEKVLEEQFKTYLIQQGVDPEELNEAQQKIWRRKHKEKSFPGASISMKEIASMLTASDPGAALGAKAVSTAADLSRAPKVLQGVTSRPIIVIQKNKTKRAASTSYQASKSLAAASLSQLKGGCPAGWVSSTKDAYFKSTYCYKVLGGLYNLNEAKRACQKKRAILLEFDTRGEVEDFHLLLKDGHLILETKYLWIGVKHHEAVGFLFIYNQLEAEVMLGLGAPPRPGLDCGVYNLTDSRILPVSCEEKRVAVCTTSADNGRRRRKSVVFDMLRNITEYNTNWEEQPDHKRVKREIKAPKFDIFLNPEKHDEQADIEKKLSIKFRDVFKRMNLSNSFPAVFELLWHSVNPCFDIRRWTSDYRDEKSTIKRCWWKGIPVNCTAIFKTNPTDRGMCCTFNARAAEDIYRETMFSRSVARLQKMNANNSFEEINMPMGFDTGEEPMPEIGKNRGLTLIVDSHANIASPGTVGDDFEGFLSVVNSAEKFPSLTEKGFVIRPGHENLVAMGAVDTIAEEAIRAINASIRECYFKDEYTLKMHKLYSQSGCVFECLLKYGRSLDTSAGCTPWFYPSLDTNMCDPWQSKAFVKGIFGGAASKQCTHCLPDCASTTYSSSVSATPLRRCDTKNIGLSMLCKFSKDLPHPAIWSQQVVNEYKKIYPGEELPDFIKDFETRSARRQYLDPKKKVKEVIFEDLYGDDGEDSYNAYERDIAVIHFFFQEGTVFQFQRSLRMTWVDFVGQIGGLLGLCMGFSFISGVEILYWFSVKLTHRVCFGRNRPVTPKSVAPYTVRKEEQNQIFN